MSEVPTQFEKTYERRRYVSYHAIEMLRTRWAKRARAVHIDDEGLGNLIDASIDKALKADAFENIVDKGEPCRLVHLRDYLDDELYAIVKTNTEQDSQWAQAIVTLLDDEIVSRYKQSGRWGAVAAGSTAKLGDKFGGVLREMRPKPPPTPVVDTLLVEYHTNNSKVAYYVEYPRAEISARLAELLENTEIDHKSIRVWREVKTKVKVDVDLG